MNGKKDNSPSQVKLFRATASSVKGEFQRPAEIKVPELDSAELLEGESGRSWKRLLKSELTSKLQETAGLISFEEAYLEVGGSYDELHKRQTSYALAVINGVNVAGMLTADRVVSRMLVYSPDEGHAGDYTFDITGSFFENLKIAGHKIDIKLDTYKFHEFNSYSEFFKAYKAGKADDYLIFNELGNLRAEKLKELESQYCALSDLHEAITKWQTNTQAPNGPYSCSAVSHLNLEDHTGTNSELEGYGAVILIPKFGVIRLAEVEIERDPVTHRDTRTLTMFRVDMCSTGHGSTTGGTTTGGGTPTVPSATNDSTSAGSTGT